MRGNFLNPSGIAINNCEAAIIGDFQIFTFTYWSGGRRAMTVSSYDPYLTEPSISLSNFRSFPLISTVLLTSNANRADRRTWVKQKKKNGNKKYLILPRNRLHIAFSTDLFMNTCLIAEKYPSMLQME